MDPVLKRLQVGLDESTCTYHACFSGSSIILRCVLVVWPFFDIE